MWVKSRVRIAFRYGFGSGKTFWKLGELNVLSTEATNVS